MTKPKAFKMRPSVIMRYGYSEPSADTLTIPPIRSLVDSYLSKSGLSVDPFARDCKLADITNDLNPNTSAQYHMKALDFLLMLQQSGVRPDLVIFDPPYSMGQAKEHYLSFGQREFTQVDARNVGTWQAEKRVINNIIKPKGIVIHMGWHSNAMPRKYGFRPVEILLVAHGRSHHDTIVTVAEKRFSQLSLI